MNPGLGNSGRPTTKKSNKMARPAELWGTLTRRKGPYWFDPTPRVGVTDASTAITSPTTAKQHPSNAKPVSEA